MKIGARQGLSGLLLIAGLLSYGWASAEKPSGPLKLVWTAEAVESSPDLVDLTFTVTSRRDVSELTLSVELPVSVSPVEGDLGWKGPARKNEPVTISLRIRSSGGQDEIIGRAAADFSGVPKKRRGSVWTQASSITLNEHRAEKPLSRSRQSRDGETIREIPLQ